MEVERDKAFVGISLDCWCSGGSIGGFNLCSPKVINLIAAEIIACTDISSMVGDNISSFNIRKQIDRNSCDRCSSFSLGQDVGRGGCGPVMTLSDLPQVCSRKQMLVGTIGPEELGGAFSKVRNIITNDGETACQSGRGPIGFTLVIAGLACGISVELEHERDHGGGSEAIVVCADE